MVLHLMRILKVFLCCKWTLLINKWFYVESKQLLEYRKHVRDLYQSKTLTGGMEPGSWGKAKIHFSGLGWHMRNSQGLEPGFVQLSGKTHKGWSGPWIRFQSLGLQGGLRKQQQLGEWLLIHPWLVVVVALQLGVGLTMSLSWVSSATSPLVIGKTTHSSACFSSCDQDLAQWVWNRCVINIAREFGGVNIGGQ